MGSTNGTYVDGIRITARIPVIVAREQRVTLGVNVPLPWPDGNARQSPAQHSPTQVTTQQVSNQGATARPPRAVTSDRPRDSRVIRIGRSPDSDVVLDYPMISWEHARIVERNGQHILEDLNSRNGTAINELQNRISEAALLPSDDVYFASFKIAASRLLSGQGTAVGEAAYEPVNFSRDSIIIGRDPGCEQPLDSPMISWHHARLQRTAEGTFVEDLGSLNGTFVDGIRIGGRVIITPGQEVALASFRFQFTETGALQRRENQGNVLIQAVDVTVNTADGKRLLDPISLTVYPSELVALMGPAGAGKTTFLKALNGYTPPAQGQVLFNGSDLYRSYDLFRQQLGYVPQDDIVHSQLTVREALYFSTKLRTDLSDKEIEERIDKILSELGILDKKNSIIGSAEHKVLSGGQRKRVNIAMELISDTPVLFLDEPNSGLSSYDAEGVVDLLKRLSREGKTIITTIHQPSIDVYRKFDNLIMISRDAGGCGALAFFGPAYPDSIEFFHGQASDSKGTQLEQPAEKELSPEMLLTGLAKAKTSEWCDRYAKSRYRKQFVEDRAGKVPPSGDQDTKAGRRFGFGQWLMLVRRNIVLKLRDRAQLVILLLQAPLFRGADRDGLQRDQRAGERSESQAAGIDAVLRRDGSQHRRTGVSDDRGRCLVRMQQRGPRHRGRMGRLSSRTDGEPETAVVRLFEVCGAGGLVRVPVPDAADHRVLCLRPERKLLADGGDPDCLVAGRGGAGPGDFSPQQHDGKRDCVAARGVAAGHRAGRWNSSYLQNADAGAMAELCCPVALGV